jgi:NAD(P)-dependent dehydrogenase (short-subunit alcohol dehydrogenase family)
MNEPSAPVLPVALVTGAGRGIGRAIAVALARTGWRVVINYKGNAAAAGEARDLAQAAGGEAIAVQGDVADRADRGRLVAATLETFGGIDMLVNNAGMGPRVRTDMLQVSEESYDEVMAANLKGPFFLTQRVANVMIDQAASNRPRLPVIINIGSLSSYASSPQRAEYCVSKAGLSMTTALWADRLAEHGICVYEVRPGIIRTDLTAVVAGKYDKLIAEGLLPIRRWGEPEDVAQATVAIAEGRLGYSTGEIINVDGGFHLRRL